MADYDTLGQQVRQAWIDYRLETGDRKPSHIAPWAEISEWDREADRRIARALVTPFVRDRYRLEEEIEQQRTRIAELEREKATVRQAFADMCRQRDEAIRDETALRTWQERAGYVLLAVATARSLDAASKRNAGIVGEVALIVAETQEHARALLAGMVRE